MNKKKIVFPAAIGVAAVWFGSHAGGGFATGRQEVQFFVQFGWTAAWIGIVAMLLLGIVVYNALEFSRLHDIHDYKNFFRKLYAPVPFLAEIWDLLYLYGAVLAVSAVIAAASQLLYDTLRLPFILGTLLVAGVLLLFTIFGAGLVRKASTAMCAFIVVALVIVTFLGISKGSGNLQQLISQSVRAEGVGYGKILWMALLYGAFQAILVAPIISVSETLKTRKNSFITALCGFLINGSMLALVCIMLLGFYPGVNEQVLPVPFVTGHLGFPWLNVLYQMILLLALLSTGVGLIFGVVKRFEISWTNTTGFFKNVHSKRVAICLACMILGVAISQFGLKKIVAKGYGSLGLFSLFLTIIPLLAIAPLKNRKARLLNQEKR